uniref:Uncharacterized protein n=1 Tax=Oryza barthii TaxID=65489 RepID=A0A0D3G644_9ORYZ
MTAANKVGVWYSDLNAATVVGAEKAAAAVRAEKAATSAVVRTDKVSAGKGGWWARWGGQALND